MPPAAPRQPRRGCCDTALRALLDRRGVWFGAAHLVLHPAEKVMDGRPRARHHRRSRVDLPLHRRARARRRQHLRQRPLARPAPSGRCLLMTVPRRRPLSSEVVHWTSSQSSPSTSGCGRTIRHPGRWKPRTFGPSSASRLAAPRDARGRAGAYIGTLHPISAAHRWTRER
jgi:hypothetical protein